MEAALNEFLRLCPEYNKPPMATFDIPMQLPNSDDETTDEMYAATMGFDSEYATD